MLYVRVQRRQRIAIIYNFRLIEVGDARVAARFFFHPAVLVGRSRTEFPNLYAGTNANRRRVLMLDKIVARRFAVTWTVFVTHHVIASANHIVDGEYRSGQNSK